MKIVILTISCFVFALLLPLGTYGQQTAEGIQSFTLQVKGVGCKEDIRSIASNVKKLDGVIKCEPLKRGATTKFEVDFDPAITSRDLIYAAVEDTPGCKNPNSRPYKVKNKG